MISTESSPFLVYCLVPGPFQEGFLLRPKLRLRGKRSSTVQIFVNGALFPSKAEADATALWWRPGLGTGGRARGWEAVTWRLARDCNVGSWQAACLLDKIFSCCLARPQAEEGRGHISLTSGFPAHTETRHTVGPQLTSLKSPPGQLLDQLPLSSQSHLGWATLGGCTALATSLMVLCLGCLICATRMLKGLPHRVARGFEESLCLNPAPCLACCWR